MEKIFIVEGSVLIDPKLAQADESNENSESKYMVLYTTDGEEFIKKEVTETEFKRYL